jgi:SNF2 family DNA or RNA helicase
MTVLQGAWLRPDALALWGERSAREELSDAKAGGNARRHPFALAGGELQAAIAGQLAAEVAERLGFAASRGPVRRAETDVVLHLPGTASTPMSSPELVQPQPARPTRGAVRVRPWRVPAVIVDRADALVILAEWTPDSASSHPGLGASVRWLAQAAEFARDLVARGRVLPGIEPEAGGALAVWRAVLSGADEKWAQALAAAAPPVLAAGVSPGFVGGGSDAEGLRDVVVVAMDDLIDAAAGDALAVWPFGYRKRSRDTPLRSAWVAALGSRQRRFDGTDEEIHDLAAALVDWQQEAVAGPVRACFRLVEPAVGDLDAGTGVAVGETAKEDIWALQFLLQSAEQPTLMASADEIWRSEPAARALGGFVPAPQEALLAELGRASRLYPALNRALRRPHPTVLQLDTAEAHSFLREHAAALASAGFGVLVPTWWTRAPAQIGWQLTASGRTQPGQAATAGDVLDRKAMVDFRWHLALGDQPLSSAELTELSRAHAGLIRLRGHWVELDPDLLDKALSFLESSGEGDVGDLLRLTAGIVAGPAGIPVSDVVAEGWLAELLQGPGGHRPASLTPPENFVGELRPYQARGVAWLRFLDDLAIGGILADDMGLGKTVEVLALLAGDQRDAVSPGLAVGVASVADAARRRTLLVCPMSIVGNWQREAASFTPKLSVYVHHGADRVRDEESFQAAVANADLVVTTYALAARDEGLLRSVHWDRLVLDEAQAIKNAGTQQSAALRALPVRRRIALTGTPVENRLADLWSLLDFVNPGLLGSATHFSHRFAIPIEKYDDEAAAERLRRTTGPLILRRLKSDRSVIADLPAKFELDVLCNLTREQAVLYQATVDDMLDRIQRLRGMQRRGLILTTLTRLKQVCNHPGQLADGGGEFAGGSGKVERIEEILEQVQAAGDKALMFTQYASFGAELRAHLSAYLGTEVLFLHGGLSQPARDVIVTRFQDESRAAPRVLLASLKAGGTGLNLTAAQHVVHIDRWWNPAVEDQATDRAYRIGQTRDVQVRKLVCVGTIEERIAELINGKRALAGRIVGSGEGWLTELSTSALQEALKLGVDAVGE